VALDVERSPLLLESSMLRQARSRAPLCRIILSILIANLLACRKSPGAARFTPDTFRAEYLFVASSTTGRVSSLAINLANGALTGVPGSGILAGAMPPGFTAAGMLAADPSGRFLYVVNRYGCVLPTGANPGCVSAFAIDPASGMISPIAGSPFALTLPPSEVAGEPGSAAIDPSGKFLYVASDTQHAVVSAFAIDPASGALTQIEGSPLTSGVYSKDVAVDPLGFVYVVNAYAGLADSGGGTVAAFAIDPATGRLKTVSGSPFRTGQQNSSELVIDPSGKFVYVANTGSANIAGFSVNHDSGVLTAIAGSPFEAVTQPRAMAIDRSGKFLYVASETEGTSPLIAFSIDSETGALKPLAHSQYSVGVVPKASTLDPSGKFLYVGAGDSISAFSINPETGELTALIGTRTNQATGLAAVGIK
jgi:6-phosphogluconolactonase